MEIGKFVREGLVQEKFVPGQTPIRLQEVPFGAEELTESIESLLSTYLVMGKKCRAFEESWSRWLGREHSVFVNSGTSALLLAMMWLKFHKVPQTGRDEILIPAVTWSTSLFPAIVVGLRPVLVDVDLTNLCVNSFSRHITARTLAVMPVHLLGHACDMGRIMEEARQHEIVVIEDCCEAHGTRHDGRKVGTFGAMGVWSYMFAHHITTIEGGMISLAEEELADTLRMFRAHGWIRETSEEHRQRVIRENPEIHPSFLFPEIGLNVRPTELSAAFGIHQLGRLDGYIERRRAAFDRITEGLKPFSDHILLFPEREREFFSPFAYPIVVREHAPFDRGKLVRHLEKKRIETRPIEGSNLALQPFMRKYRELVEVRGELPNATTVHRNGFFFGLNQDTDENRIAYIVEALAEFLRRV